MANPLLCRKLSDCTRKEHRMDAFAIEGGYRVQCRTCKTTLKKPYGETFNRNELEQEQLVSFQDDVQRQIDQKFNELFTVC
jgi:hypothetical protein